MNIRKIQFLSVGLTRVYPRDKRNRTKTTTEKLVEPTESRSYRRKILTLSGIIVITGLSGGDPSNLSVVGVNPTEGRLPVLLMALIVIQLYWYFQKFHHLKEDGEIEQEPTLSPDGRKSLKISRNDAFTLVRKSADLYSNYVAFILTLFSWYFAFSWVI